MSDHSRRLAGILLVLLPTVIAGGASILAVIDDPAYRDNELRQDLWRAGHAHAGVLLVLALVALRYVDEARLGTGRNPLPVIRSPRRPSSCLWPSFFQLPEPTPPNPTL